MVYLPKHIKYKRNVVVLEESKGEESLRASSGVWIWGRRTGRHRGDVCGSNRHL